MKLIAIDYGRRRIGCALCSEEGAAVRGLPTIDRKKDPAFFSTIVNLIEREKPDRLILGLPLDGNDAETVMSKEVRTFAGKLAQRTGLPVCFVDESFTSIQAARIVQHRNKKERRDKGTVDRIAACLILDQYIRENGCA